MANSIDGASGPGYAPPMVPLPVFGTIERAARTFAKAPFTLIGIALIPVVPALVIGGLRILAPHSAHLVLTLVSFVVQYATQFVVAAALVIVTRNVIDDRERAVGEALQHSLRRLLPLVALFILQFLAILIGMIALIVPGVIVALMLFVALPACALEGLGSVESLKRSARLTKGHRWRLFGIAMLAMLTVWATALVLVGAVATSSKVLIGIAVLLAVVVSIALGGVVLTLPVVVFLYLRQWHEPGATTARV